MSNGNPLKQALGTVLRGFLFGIGFTVAAGGGLYLLQQITMRNVPQFMNGGAARSRDIRFSDVAERTDNGSDTILGTLTNAGTEPARALEVQANLFDHGKFVDQYGTFIKGTVQPGESRYFKISCGCADKPPAVHDSFKVEVVGGY